MAALTCDICGGKLVMGSGGIATCDSCGMEYSIERIREKVQEIRGSVKVEGTVEVQGTVKMDNTDYVKKYLENARRAREKEDWEETEKYYNLVEQNDPNNIEAIFYSAYGKARASLVDGDIYKRQAVFKVLQNCISIIDDNYDASREEDNKIAITSMAHDLIGMINSSFVFTEWKNGHGIVTKTNQNETYALFGNLISSFRESILNIIAKDDQFYMHETLFLLYGAALGQGHYNNQTLSRWMAEESAAMVEMNKARTSAYWAEHSSEKEQLEAEKAVLTEKIEAATAEFLQSLPAMHRDVTATNEEINKQIEELFAQRSTLSIFQIKLTKEIDDKITALEMQKNDLKAADAVHKEELELKLEPFKKRIAEIDEELTRNR